MHREGIRLAANDSSVLFYGLPLSSSNSIFIAWKWPPHVSLLVNYKLLPLALKPLLETECSKTLLLTQGSVPAAPWAVRVLLCPWGPGTRSRSGPLVRCQMRKAMAAAAGRGPSVFIVIRFSTSKLRASCCSQERTPLDLVWTGVMAFKEQQREKEKTHMASPALLIPSHMGLCETLLKSVQVKSIIFPWSRQAVTQTSLVWCQLSFLKSRYLSPVCFCILIIISSNICFKTSYGIEVQLMICTL